MFSGRIKKKEGFMAGSHFLLSSIFIFLLWFYAVPWDVKSRLFSSTLSPSITGHDVTSVKESSTTFLILSSSWKGFWRHLVFDTPRKYKFLASRVGYYPNSVSCFHQLGLALSSDVQLNSGPTTVNPCSAKS